jgi:UDP-2,4-diacetamido-2,4,6-trideoxy-beta-L-altropyranose hydrolase
MSNICILTEGGNNRGLGHISRCLSLCQIFDLHNCDVKLIINADPSVNHLLYGYDFLLADWNKRESEIIEIIKSADLLIIDSYHCTKELYEIFSNISPKVAYIDDFNRLDYPKGIVINGILGAEKIKYTVQKNKEYLLGADYAFLRKEYWNLSKRKIEKKISSVLVFCGGYDTKRINKKVLEILIRFYPKINVSVVVRDLEIPDIDFIKANSNVFSNLQANQMIDLMLSCDIAITASGQTTYELSKTGTPFIPIKTAENQTLSINEFFNLGLVGDIINYDDLEFNTKIFNEFEKLKSYQIRKERSIKLQKTIKGEGPNRIVEKLLTKIN